MNAQNTPSPAGQAPPTAKALPRRATANPLVSRKKQAQRPHQQIPRLPTTQAPAKGAFPPNGINGTQKTPSLGHPGLQARQDQPQPVQAQEEYVDYPIYTTKREILDGLRHHVMRFLPTGSSKVRNVNIADESQFPRPVKLHRRDPRANVAMQWRENGEEYEEPKPNGMDEKEKERLEASRAERRAEREANQAQMAPVAKQAQIKKNNFQKKTEQVFQVNTDKAHKVKDFQLRYEEALPWHIEDFDSKNTWSGTYEGALSDCHVMLLQEEDAQGGQQFRMVPIEKWYKFTAKNLFKALSIEEAEARMSKRVKDPRWFMETQKASQQASKELSSRRGGGGKLYTRAGERGERAVKGEGDEGPEVAHDIDDIDYNYEEAFADDEENALFEGGEEESKEAEDRIKREQREANIFELKEQKDFEKEEEEAKRKAQEEKKLAKKVRKALMKQEKNYVYEEDSDGNPYSSESESEDSEVERQKEEERKKEEEKQQADKGKGPATSQIATDASKPASTPGTPSKVLKTSDPLRKGILKRPGSPNLSEASGSESSRVKKPKKKHTLGESSSTISRPTSPANAANNAASDTEMSDGSKQAKRLKLRLGAGTSRPATPSGSRPSSPAPSALSASTTSATATPALQAALPTDDEIRARIPEQGILLQDLIKTFSSNSRIMRNPEFIPLIKANARWDKATKMLYPKAK